MVNVLVNGQGKVYMLNGQALCEANNNYTLTITPTGIGSTTAYVVSDNNGNVLYTNTYYDSTVKTISFSSSVTSITISNLTSGNPTSSGNGCLSYTPTNCTVDNPGSPYYNTLTLTNLTSNSSIIIEWSYGPLPPSGPDIDIEK